MIMRFKKLVQNSNYLQLVPNETSIPEQFSQSELNELVRGFRVYKTEAAVVASGYKKIICCNNDKQLLFV